ncbi:hypothetical protein CTAYLR_000341 [Chrysophaeum taylorii]|uniref:Conserved oligomeric Golgi complex subunit 6 n=1 Tax=Chrysophaeum taylorii TaxID=2483200 RepID=A0AAD7UG02_9STRA|nr:hypothetical protein CTAYLR_000341 [Chrysophaeum taylorii]
MAESMTTSQQQSHAMIERKVKRILEVRLDDPELLEALEVVGEFWTENTAENRRNLRSSLERRSVELAERFLVEFGPVKEALARVERRSAQLEAHVGKVSAEVRRCDDECRAAVALEEETNARLEEEARQQKEVAEFVALYKLEDSEVAALEKGEIDEAFFEALAKTRSAKEKCGEAATREILAGASAIELIETLSAQHEAAFGRLYEWTLEQLAGDDTIGALSRGAELVERAAGNERSPLALALRELGGVATFASDIEEAVIKGRAALLVSRFEATPRPGTAAFRNVADAVAWAHQAAATEAEVLEAAGCGAGLSRVTDALAEPLGKHVDAAVAKVKEDAVVLRRLSSVLEYYATVFAGALPDRLRACAAAARDACELRVARAVKTLDATSIGDFARRPTPDAPLGDETVYGGEKFKFERSASEAAISAVHLAVALLTVETDPPLVDSLVAAVVRKLERSTLAGRDFHKTGDFVGRDPVPQSRRRRKDYGEAADWTPSDSRLFVANTAAAASRAFWSLQRERPPAAAAVRTFDQIAAAALDDLAKHEASNILRRCKLAPILEHARRADLVDDVDVLGGRAANLPGLEPPALAAALRTFYSSLFSNPTPDLSALVDAQARATTRNSIATILARAHETVYALASDPLRGGYDDTSFLVHTPRQVSVLLDCDDDHHHHHRKDDLATPDGTPSLPS